MEALQWILSTGTSFFEGVQLSNDLDRLRATLPKARMLICRSEWGMFKDKQLAKLLSHLKDTTYDAEDLLRQLDDQVLRQRIEDADRSRAGQLLSSSLNLAKTYIRGSKGRIKETQEKLDKVVAEIEGMLNLTGLMSFEPSQIMPETSSIISAMEVVGREAERNELIEMLGVMIGREAQRDQVIELLGVPLIGGSRRSPGSNGKRAAGGSDVPSTSRAKQPKRNNGRARLADINCTSNVSVIPIIGIGGVGKTTLAQYIYNDPRVKNHFGVMIWVCVSDFFDKKRITKEIIESIPGEEFNPSCSLNALQIELMERLKMCPKFLLVLDDVWPNANAEWEAFYAPLRLGPQGSMILVTTRCPVVATHVSTANCGSFHLQGLPTNVFWDFFRKCAFGTNNPESYPHLQDIGRSICTRLCGSPLAAKTLGRLLNMSLTEQHWRTIQKSELWELRHEENEILPALQLSYLYLPEEVKRCFVFCSMFPKDYSFERDEIVDVWVAEGFVVPEGSMQPEDVGIIYLDELRNRFLFQTDPKFPNKRRYVMHDLIHDMALSFSMDECLAMQDLSSQTNCRLHSTVRHMSMEVDGETLIRMGDEFQLLNKLHSLRFRVGFDVEITWFSQLSNILYLSLKGCRLVNLPESISELNSLRYLDISESSVKELPRKLCYLYSLQVLNASRSSLRRIDEAVTKLINLRQLALPADASEALSRVSGLGNLSSLRNLRSFSVAKESGRGIGELKFMNQLNGVLKIRSLAYVGSTEEAAEARLVDKHLKELVLQWRERGKSRLMANENEVLERLCPHSTIECLKIHGFGGDNHPSWLKPEDLPTLRSLEFSNCSFLESLSVPFFSDGTQAGLTGDDGPQQASSSSSSSLSNGISPIAFTCLTALRLFRCDNLTNLEPFLTPEKLPSIKSILLEYCWKLASMPVHGFVGFLCLQDLKIFRCHKLECPREMVLPSSLRRLCIVACNELERSFPACLENLTSLTLLQLGVCKSVKYIPLNMIGSLNMLKCLVISDCPELSSIGGLQGLDSIQYVELCRCPRLTEVQLPFEKKELRTKEGKEMLKFLIDVRRYLGQNG